MKPLRTLLNELDPVHPSRSTLEAKTRRLLVAHGLTDSTREFPLEWNGRTYFFDFCFDRQRTIFETNGKRWHEDPLDYEDDNEKWSAPGRLGHRIVFATWHKVTRRPTELLDEITATLAAQSVGEMLERFACAPPTQQSVRSVVCARAPARRGKHHGWRRRRDGSSYINGVQRHATPRLSATASYWQQPAEPRRR